MKKLISVVAIVICSTWIASCSNSPTDTSQDQTNTIEPQTDSGKTQTDTQIKPDSNGTATEQPKVGTVKNMVQGDLKCYVTLLDENGTQKEVGADFEICTQETFLNKKVRLGYEILAVSDCQSAEPCGKTKQESLITKMEIISSPTPK